MNDTIRKCLMRGTAILAFSVIAYNASAVVSGSEGGGSVNEDALKLLAGTAAAEKVVAPNTIEAIKGKLVVDTTFYKKIDNDLVKPTVEGYKNDLNNLNLFINSNMVTTAKLNTTVKEQISQKFDDYIANNTTTTAVRCAVPPSCADIGFTKTAAECAGKIMLKCPLNLAKVYCGGDAALEVKVCSGKLVEKTFNNKKYCCPVFASAIAPMQNCVLQATDASIQFLYQTNYELMKNLEVAQADLVKFKTLDYDGLKTFATYKDKYLALKDMSAGNITALKSSVDVTSLNSSVSSLNTTTSKLSKAACGDPSGLVCMQEPDWGVGGIK